MRQSTLNDLHPADEFRSPDQIKWRDDLYPRFEPDPVVVKQYADDLDVLSPIQINQHGEIIDGYHRWMACQTRGVDQMPVVVTETQNDFELLCLTIQANNNKLTYNEKIVAADRLSVVDGVAHETLSMDKIAEIVSVPIETIGMDRFNASVQRHRTFDLFMEGYTPQEIDNKVSRRFQSTERLVKSFTNFALPSDFRGSVDSDRDPDFESLVHNIWGIDKLINGVNHLPIHDDKIVGSLIDTYTGFLDMVFAPFANGCGTAAVCHRRLRRCRSSDITAMSAMSDLIRQPLSDLGDQWPEVSLTYANPSYWEEFTSSADRDLGSFIAGLAEFVNRVGQKQSQGVIAMLIRSSWAGHGFDLTSAVDLDAKYRIRCPAQSMKASYPELAQYIKSKDLIARELIIWQV